MDIFPSSHLVQFRSLSPLSRSLNIVIYLLPCAHYELYICHFVSSSAARTAAGSQKDGRIYNTSKRAEPGCIMYPERYSISSAFTSVDQSESLRTKKGSISSIKYWSTHTLPATTNSSFIHLYSENA